MLYRAQKIHKRISPTQRQVGEPMSVLGLLAELCVSGDSQEHD